MFGFFKKKPFVSYTDRVKLFDLADKPSTEALLLRGSSALDAVMEATADFVPVRDVEREERSLEEFATGCAALMAYNIADSAATKLGLDPLNYIKPGDVPATIRLVVTFSMLIAFVAERRLGSEGVEVDQRDVVFAIIDHYYMLHSDADKIKHGDPSLADFHSIASSDDEAVSLWRRKVGAHVIGYMMIWGEDTPDHSDEEYMSFFTAALAELAALVR